MNGTLLARIAALEVGVNETSRNDSPRIREYWKAVESYNDGWKQREPWCAAFVSWCVKQAAGAEMRCPGFAAVRDWLHWCEARADTVAWKDSLPGDLVIYLPHFSHIGIMERTNTSSRTAFPISRSFAECVTVEGNTNDEGSREGDGVYRRVRPSSIVGSIWRLP